MKAAKSNIWKKVLAAGNPAKGSALADLRAQIAAKAPADTSPFLPVNDQSFITCSNAISQALRCQTEVRRALPLPSVLLPPM